MYDIASRIFISSFLVGYSLLLMVLAGWALSVRLKLAFKKGDASAPIWVMAIRFLVGLSNKAGFGLGWSRKGSVYARNRIRP